MVIVQTTIRINERLYQDLKDLKAEYQAETSDNVSLNRIISIAIKEFLSDDPIATLNEEVY